MKLNQITAHIINGSLRIHSTLGPGLLEQAYCQFLGVELRRRGLKVKQEVPVTAVYEGVEVECAFRIDLLVNDAVVVELKALKRLLPVHEAQLLSYLRIAGFKIGLLINFHELHLRDGIRRLVNGYEGPAPSAPPRPPT